MVRDPAGLAQPVRQFPDVDNKYSIYGSNDNGSSDSRSFGLRSAYMLAGFNLAGYFTDGVSHSDIPEVLQGSTQGETATSGSRGYGFAAGHPLPLHGGFSANVNRSDVNSDFLGNNYNGTIDT